MANAHQIDTILRWHNAHIDVRTTAQRLNLDEQEVRDIIKATRRPAPTKPAPPEFSDAPLF